MGTVAGKKMNLKAFREVLKQRLYVQEKAGCIGFDCPD